MTEIWFKDPLVLFQKQKVFDFWPSKNQTATERVNASSRFILYASTFIFLVKRDPKIFILALMGLAVLYVLYAGNVIQYPDTVFPVFSHDTNFRPDCQMPTPENPMGNVMLTDYTNNPDRPPACYYPTVKKEVRQLVHDMAPHSNFRSRAPLPEYQKNYMARQFTSMPVTSLSGEEQTDFAEALYGKKFGPMCRSDQSVCSPDARGVQLEAFGGLDPSGKRSGMTRGTTFRG